MILNNLTNFKAWLNNNDKWNSNVSFYTDVVGVNNQSGTAIKVIQSVYNSTYIEPTRCIIEYAKPTSVITADFSSDSISEYTKDSYVMSNLVNLTGLIVQQSSSSVNGVYTNRITLTAQNSSSSDVTIRTIGLFTNIPYMTSPSSGSIQSQSVLVAIFELDELTTIVSGETFTITLDWVEQ